MISSFTLKCPNCGTDFSVKASECKSITEQVKSQYLSGLRADMEKDKQEAVSAAVELTKAECRVHLVQERDRHTAEKASIMEQKASELADRDSQIADLQKKLITVKAESNRAAERQIDELSVTVERLNMQLESAQNQTKVSVAEAIQEKAEENARLQAELDNVTFQLKEKEKATETEIALAVAQTEQRMNEQIKKKSDQVLQLQGTLDRTVSDAFIAKQELEKRYELQLQMKDEQIQQYKDFKLRQSTKMIGESLEQHCLSEFNAIRATAFPNAHFEKDNTVVDGTKGDFVYRESVDDTELISIMFEMKNESEGTASKHKNEDFLAKLDKDRTNKGCEYAVLVSMLEADSELYNRGIVDVSYRYPKMFVIRPQFFIPLISLLRNAAMSNFTYKTELTRIKHQDIDLEHFEANMETFKASFGKNYRLASERLNTAVEGIDKVIAQLQKTKEALLSSENNLRLANNKAESLSIDKLTKDAPSIRRLIGAASDKDKPKRRPRKDTEDKALA